MKEVADFKNRREKFCEVLQKVIACAILLLVTVALLYLSVVYDPKCFIAFGIWMLSFVFYFVPMSSDGPVDMRPTFAILCMLTAFVILFSVSDVLHVLYANIEEFIKNAL